MKVFTVDEWEILLKDKTAAEAAVLLLKSLPSYGDREIPYRAATEHVTNALEAFMRGAQ